MIFLVNSSVATSAVRSAVTISLGMISLVTYGVMYAVIGRVNSMLIWIVIESWAWIAIGVPYVLVTFVFPAVLTAIVIVVSLVMPSESLRSASVHVGGATCMRLRLCNIPF